jgi:hypothetical protein
VRETGILAATGGIASAQVVRPARGAHQGHCQCVQGSDSVTTAATATATVTATTASLYSHTSDLFFLFILRGSLQCCIEDHFPQQESQSQSQQQLQLQLHDLCTGSSIVIPANTPFEIHQWSPDVEVLEIQVYR